MSFLIESVDDCGRRALAKWLVEAGPRLGVRPEITGLRHAWACVVSLNLAHNFLLVAWLSRSSGLMSLRRGKATFLSVSKPEVT